MVTLLALDFAGRTTCGNGSLLGKVTGESLFRPWVGQDEDRLTVPALLVVLCVATPPR
jgi:hypothetical protein